MPTFDTPEPITVTAHIDAGAIQFTAGDRPDTVVEVRPSDPKRDQDVRAADQTDVSYAGGALTIRARKPNLFGRAGTVNVTVELPTGSRVDVSGAWAQVLGEGRLGDVRVRTSAGDVRLDTTQALHLKVSHGSISVARVAGKAEITTSVGSLRLGVLDGPAVVKNSHGSTTIGAATGELRVKAANGDISIDRTEGSVAATTAHGSLRVGDVARGTAELETAVGAIEIGIREGTAAWLDVSSRAGQVRNRLTAAEAPDDAGNAEGAEGTEEEKVSIRARTRFGNIDILRARA